MFKFVYKNKKTGRKVYSNNPREEKNLELVSEVRGGLINNIIKKNVR